jgi:hypothetical protein
VALGGLQEAPAPSDGLRAGSEGNELDDDGTRLGATRLAVVSPQDGADAACAPFEHQAAGRRTLRLLLRAVQGTIERLQEKHLVALEREFAKGGAISWQDRPNTGGVCKTHRFFPPPTVTRKG